MTEFDLVFCLHTGSTLQLEAKALPTDAQKYLFFLLTSAGEVGSSLLCQS